MTALRNALSILSLLFILTACGGGGVDILVTDNDHRHEGDGDDYGYSIKQTSDRGYIIAGSTSSYGEGGQDVYLLKKDRFGRTVWETTFGGSGFDAGHQVIQTRDGNFVIAGSTNSFGRGADDVYVIKTDSNGRILWEVTRGGSGIDIGHSIVGTSDGGYVIAGSTTSYGEGRNDVYLIKLDRDGYLIWETAFGGQGDDLGYSIKETPDAGFIITGSTTAWGYGADDVYLVKTNSNGAVMWETAFGDNGPDIGYSVDVTADAGYIITGFTTGDGYMEDVYLVKTDLNGYIEWQSTFGGSAREFGYSVRETSDGDYIIAGSTGSYGSGLDDVYLIKTDNRGDAIFEAAYGGSDIDIAYSVDETTDGGYAVVGAARSFGYGDYDVYFLKTDINGYKEL